MADIEFIDQTLRDGHQSLWGMRMQAGQILPVAEEIDRTGFRVVDVTGSSMFEVLVRYCREDPWAGLDLIAEALPHCRLRAGSRSNAIVGFSLNPNSLLELWIRTLAKHGIGSFWIYDCLFNIEQMRWMCGVVHDAGAEVVPSIMYGLSPVHTDEFFADKARQLAGFDGVSAIYVEDAPGVLKPERARTLWPALVDAADGVPLELHCHNTTGLAPINYLIGIEAGATIIHTASRPLANGPSLPSTEAMVENVRRDGHTTNLDDSRLSVVADHFRYVAEREGYLVGVPNEYFTFNYEHQLPGGMTGTLKNQLAQYNMSHRLQEVLEECAVVRQELGYPVSATPFSQLIGIQSVLNVVTGDRYSIAPDEVIIYALGHLGPFAAPLDEDVKDRILSSQRGKEFAAWEAPQPSLKELRHEYGENLSDEELLLRALIPGPDVDAMKAAGPPRRHYPKYETPAATFLHDLMTKANARYLHVERPEFSLTLRR
jgi:oxaloacetate decarboxylase alpha subunit